MAKSNAGGKSESLDEQPWVSMNTESKTSLITKFMFKENSYELLLCDGETCYYENVDKEELKERNKECNPSLELTQGKLLSLIKSAFTDERNVRTTVRRNGEEIHCSFSYSISGTRFQWKIVARRQMERMGTDLLSPLFQMIEELSRRQAVLFSKLRDKDKEIDDLKNQGVKCSRKHLETPIFDETLFNESMKNSKPFRDICKAEKTMGFSTITQAIYKDVILKKEEPEDIEISLSATSNSPAKSSTGSPKKTPEKMKKEAVERKKAEELNTPVVQSKKKKKLKI